jgi:hypothetical protein
MVDSNCLRESPATKSEEYIQHAMRRFGLILLDRGCLDFSVVALSRARRAEPIIQSANIGVLDVRYHLQGSPGDFKAILNVRRTAWRDVMPSDGATGRYDLAYSVTSRGSYDNISRIYSHSSVVKISSAVRRAGKRTSKAWYYTIHNYVICGRRPWSKPLQQRFNSVLPACRIRTQETFVSLT